MARYIFFVIFIFFYSNVLKADSRIELISKLIIKFNNIENFQFNFIQKNKNLIETGNCFIKYPKKLICRYDGKEGKEIVIRNKTLAIVKRTYEKVYFYRISNSVFNILLDKKKIISKIKKLKKIKKVKNFYLIVFENKNSSKLKLYLDIKTLNIAGWETSGFDQQKTAFKILNIKINTDIKEKFEIPDFNN